MSDIPASTAETATGGTVQVTLGRFACTVEGFEDPAAVLRAVLGVLRDAAGEATGEAFPDVAEVLAGAARETGVAEAELEALPGMIVRRVAAPAVAEVFEPVQVPVAPPPVAPTPAAPLAPGPNLFVVGAVPMPPASAVVSAEPEPAPFSEAPAPVAEAAEDVPPLVVVAEEEAVAAPVPAPPVYPAEEPEASAPPPFTEPEPVAEPGAPDVPAGATLYSPDSAEDLPEPAATYEAEAPLAQDPEGPAADWSVPAESPAPVAPLAEPPVAPATLTAAEYVERIGAWTPEDRMAACAAWLCHQSGGAPVERRTLLNAAADLPGGETATLSDRLRTLGALVQWGRLSVAPDGSLLASPQDLAAAAEELPPAT